MKKQILWIVLVLFAASLFIMPAFALEVKIGYLDVAKVFDEYKKTKEQDVILESQAKFKQSERDKMVSEITRLRDEMELLSEKGKKDKQVVIEEKVKKSQEFDNVVRGDLRKKRDDVVADILKEIDAVVQGYGKKQGFDMILNDKVIIYKKDALNVTDDILKTLNAQYTTSKPVTKQ